MDWAVMAHIAPLLVAGARIWHAPQPFEHAKLMTIDGGWSLVGSANWDQRSLRLNFELDMEVYDRGLAAQIADRIDREIAQSDPVTIQSLDAIPYPKRLRNRIIWLASPYL
jgi:cardiolipin synthase